MTPRRLFLLSAALVLALADGFWLYRRATEPNAIITYVGLDSMMVIVPQRLRAARWHGDRWDVDPLTPLRRLPPDWGVGIPRQPIAYVSLESEQTLGRAGVVLRELKRRRICNVLVREMGEPEPVTFGSAERPERAIGIHALTLCGHSLGDAGFFGTLPPDRAVLVR